MLGWLRRLFSRAPAASSADERPTPLDSIPVAVSITPPTPTPVGPGVVKAQRRERTVISPAIDIADLPRPPRPTPKDPK